jgi:hypothetical protein
VQPSPFGVRNAPNGEAFMNIEGSALLTFASYAGLRFDIAPVAAKFDAAYGAGNWTISSAYLYLQQANAAFTAGGDVEIVYTNNDSINLANNAVPEVTFYDNYLTDYTDLTQVTQYTFAQGPEILPGNPIGSGTIESYKIADISGNPGMLAVRGELASAYSGRRRWQLRPDDCRLRGRHHTGGDPGQGVDARNGPARITRPRGQRLVCTSL